MIETMIKIECEVQETDLMTEETMATITGPDHQEVK